MQSAMPLLLWATFSSITTDTATTNANRLYHHINGITIRMPESIGRLLPRAIAVIKKTKEFGRASQGVEVIVCTDINTYICDLRKYIK